MKFRAIYSNALQNTFTMEANTMYPDRYKLPDNHAWIMKIWREKKQTIKLLILSSVDQIYTRSWYFQIVQLSRLICTFSTSHHLITKLLDNVLQYQWELIYFPGINICWEETRCRCYPWIFTAERCWSSSHTWRKRYVVAVWHRLSSGPYFSYFSLPFWFATTFPYFFMKMPYYPYFFTLKCHSHVKIQKIFLARSDFIL